MGQTLMNPSYEQNQAGRDRPTALLAPCACGEDAVWYRARPTPENAPDHAVCFLMDADFSDNYCEACFVQTVPAADRLNWTRLSPAGVVERTFGE